LAKSYCGLPIHVPHKIGKKIPCVEYQNCIKHNTKIGLDIAGVLKCSNALFVTKAKLIFYLVVSNDEPHSNSMLASG
jgi:hypothetical protein